MQTHTKHFILRLQHSHIQKKSTNKNKQKYDMLSNENFNVFKNK